MKGCTPPWIEKGNTWIKQEKRKGRRKYQEPFRKKGSYDKKKLKDKLLKEQRVSLTLKSNTPPQPLT